MFPTTYDMYTIYQSFHCNKTSCIINKSYIVQVMYRSLSISFLPFILLPLPFSVVTQGRRQQALQLTSIIVRPVDRDRAGQCREKSMPPDWPLFIGYFGQVTEFLWDLKHQKLSSREEVQRKRKKNLVACGVQRSCGLFRVAFSHLEDVLTFFVAPELQKWPCVKTDENQEVNENSPLRLVWELLWNMFHVCGFCVLQKPKYAPLWKRCLCAIMRQ